MSLQAFDEMGIREVHAREIEQTHQMLLGEAEVGLRQLLDGQTVGTDDLMRALTTPPA